MSNCDLIKDVHPKLNHTYLSGVFIALNVISDAHLLMDSPNCCYKKLEEINKNHDLLCSIFRDNGFHRLSHTGVTPTSIIHDRQENIGKLLSNICNHDTTGCVLFCSMPMASLTGIQYDRIIRKVQKSTAVPIIEIPAKNMTGDWLNGYEDVLLSIAEKIDLTSKKKKKNSVAIVGYLMDRNEGDHQGNLSELRRIFDALSLDLVSVWLDGSSYGNLSDVEKAHTIVSLPYGRKAARKIAHKTGAKVIEMDIPFGIKKTKDWIQKLAKALKKEPEANKFIENELSAVVPILELLRQPFIMEKRFSIISDPYMANAMVSGIRELGGQIESVIITGSSKHKIIDVEATFEPATTELHGLIGNADIIIGSHIPENKNEHFLEFGFPSLHYHCLTEAPFLGFRGFVLFLNRIINNKGIE